MGHISIKYHKTPAGELILGSYEGKLCLCDWKYRRMRANIDTRIQNGIKSSYREDNTSIISLAIIQLEEYFEGARKSFDIPLLLIGTDFQKSVWEELIKIPYGQTETYGGLSARLGNMLAIRAVAAANGANAISIIVPCHRIIGSRGELTGYAGGLAAKKQLIKLEGGYSSQPELF